MHNAIWKFAIHNKIEEKLRIPKGAKILSVANQRESLVLWAAVNAHSSEEEIRTIVTMITGYAGEEFQAIVSDNFIGTVLFDNGNYVLHVFERTSNP